MRCPIGFYAINPVSLCFPIPVFATVLIKTRRVLELLFRNIGTIAVEPGIFYKNIIPYRSINAHFVNFYTRNITIR